jgi:hypothetical protein
VDVLHPVLEAEFLNHASNEQPTALDLNQSAKIDRLARTDPPLVNLEG